MKKWLNNPFVVTGLALAAVYSVYQQLSPMLQGTSGYSDTNAAIEPVDGRVAAPDMISTPVSPTRSFTVIEAGISESKTDLALASAPGMATRDPFHREAQTRQVVVKSVKKSVSRSESAAPRLPSLSAVIAGPKSRYAVIDAQIVEVGSVLGKYTVRQINGLSVSLTGPGGERVLTLKPDRQGDSHE